MFWLEEKKAISHLNRQQGSEQGSIKDDVGVRAEFHLHMQPVWGQQAGVSRHTWRRNTGGVLWGAQG